jgi:hypothetical protein
MRVPLARRAPHHVAFCALAVASALPSSAVSQSASGAPRAQQQDSTSPTTVEARVVEGRVVRPQQARVDSLAPVPVRDLMVTLHRVGRDSAGALDSLRTDASGRYRFIYSTRGASDAVYFTSVTYGGIAYFTAPLRSAQVTGEAAEITVFDTTSRVFPLSVRGRHLIVGDIDSTNMRTVIEVFELENDSMKTLVTYDTTPSRPTWWVTVPQAAKELRMNDTEVSADAFVHRPGRVEFYSPFAPGLKQLSFSYRMSASDFPVAFTNQYPVDVFEVLLEESTGNVTNEHIATVGAVNLEGRNFKRFLGQNVAADEEVMLDLPTSRPLGRNGYIAALLIVIGAAMLLMLSRAMSRRAPTSGVSVANVALPELPLQERLAREIAALDDVFARTPNPSDDVRDAYQLRRAELREALAGALAESGTVR